MYFMARTSAAKQKLIETIQSILTQNSQFDPMHSRNRAALANTLIDEYNRYHCQHLSPIGRISSKSIEQINQKVYQQTPSSVESIYTQVNWWKLLPELIAYGSNDKPETSSSPSASPHPPPEILPSSSSLSTSVSHLVSVIRLHQEEVIDTIISQIHDKQHSILSPLLTNTKHQHYPIACDWFFEGNPKILSFSNQDFLRPNLIRLFLFHDLLLVTSVPTKEGKFLYSYHIHIQDLQVVDLMEQTQRQIQTQQSGYSESRIVNSNSDSFITHPSQSNCLCLKLIDHSVKAKGFLSSIWSSSFSSTSAGGREHLLLASTIQQKISWYELFQEAIRSSQRQQGSYHDGLPHQDVGTQIKQSPPPPPLIRRISSYGDGAWKYDERVSESEKTFESIL
jgi:hypothetical protein